MKRHTFEEYLSALDPCDPVGLKESILRQADKDPGIDCMQLKQLVNRAYPEV